MRFSDMHDWRIRIVPRTFRFKQPASTSRGVYLERKVWYIVITSSNPLRRVLGIGECAPLFDLSCDYVPDYEKKLRDFCNTFICSGKIDREAMRNYPSMLFGLETAIRSAKASINGDFLQLWETPFSRGEEGIRINGLVWMGSFEEMSRRMDEKLAAGFGCIKIKIGAIDFESEMALLRKLRARYSAADVELRVDANGAFTPAEAMQKLEQLSHFGIHSIEQPIRAGQWQEMARLCKQTPLPIALDEELIGINDPLLKQQLLDTILPQYIILKPSLHGGLSGAEDWMLEAGKRNIPFWITSALESNVGLNAIAQWTAHVHQTLQDFVPDEPTRNTVLELAQGLGTGQLFTDNFRGTHLEIEGERLYAKERNERDFRKELQQFAETWNDECQHIELQTSGSTGKPKTIEAEKSRMAFSARRTCEFLGLKPGDTALLCMPLGFIAGKMMAVRSFVGNLRLITAAPSSHPFARMNFAPDFVAMTPMQVYESLRVPRERALLWRVRSLIIGGGSISQELETALQDFPGAAWSTYGMTETLSHIALRRINGLQRSDAYRPLQGITLTLSHKGCLEIYAPEICPQRLTTNDLAEFLPDGTFRILGRRDNMICSGGLKFQIEDLEEKLSALPAPFLITAVPDPGLGEAIALLYAGEAQVEEIVAFSKAHLSRHEQPKHFLKAESLPLTASGKPARAAAKALAARLYLGR